MLTDHTPTRGGFSLTLVLTNMTNCNDYLNSTGTNMWKETTYDISEPF